VKEGGRWALVAISLAAVACDAPLRPSPLPLPSSSTVPAQVAGDWQGEFLVTECTGDQQCTSRLGRPERFELRLERLGVIVQGVFVTAGRGADVVGSISPEGVVTLTGPSPGGGEGIRVDEISVRADTSQGLTGRLRYSVPGAAPPAVAAAYAGEVISAVRAAVETRGAVSTAAGRWRGSFVVRTCAPAGTSECFPFAPNEVRPLELWLAQSESTLNGQLRLGAYAFAVQGAMSGNTFTLHADAGAASPGVRLLRWSATRDRVGRLSGSFGLAATRAAGDGQATATLDANLLGVVLQPAP
jgi:hypothetical protein